MLIRHGKVIGLLNGAPALPWGFGPCPFEMYNNALEPGDSILMYTDGVVEARGSHGEDFGTSRLADLVGRFASDQLSISMIVRQVVHAVLGHHGGELGDDATVLMINWPGPLTGDP